MHHWKPSCKLCTRVFPTILYGAETWWPIDAIKDIILELERNALKRCLGVKRSTPTDIIYTEINRPDIVSCIKDGQYKFYSKLTNLSYEEALVKEVMRRCEQTNMMRYYKELNNNHKERNISERKSRLESSDATMTKRYMEITEGKYSSTIYESYMNEKLRILITRWRLSCFDLAIETGRYKHDNSRDKRLCLTCNTLEDEYHTLFVCIRYQNIRNHYSELISNCQSVSDMLQPCSTERAKLVGMYIKSIEKARKESPSWEIIMCKRCWYLCVILCRLNGMIYLPLSQL